MTLGHSWDPLFIVYLLDILQEESQEEKGHSRDPLFVVYLLNISQEESQEEHHVFFSMEEQPYTRHDNPNIDFINLIQVKQCGGGRGWGWTGIAGISR